MRISIVSANVQTNKRKTMSVSFKHVPHAVYIFA